MRRLVVSLLIAGLQRTQAVQAEKTTRSYFFAAPAYLFDFCYDLFIISTRSFRLPARAFLFHRRY